MVWRSLAISSSSSSRTPSTLAIIKARPSQPIPQIQWRQFQKSEKPMTHAHWTTVMHRKSLARHTVFSKPLELLLTSSKKNTGFPRLNRSSWTESKLRHSTCVSRQPLPCSMKIFKLSLISLLKKEFVSLHRCLASLTSPSLCTHCSRRDN